MQQAGFNFCIMTITQFCSASISSVIQILCSYGSFLTHKNKILITDIVTSKSLKFDSTT